MFIPVHLFLIGLMVFFAKECLTRPSKGHRRRQAYSFTQTKPSRNAIPIIPSDYDIPGLQLVQNKGLLYPTNVDGQGHIAYIPLKNDEAKRDDEVSGLKGVSDLMEIPDLIGRERKTLQRDQRKQPKPEEVEPCGHVQKNDYAMLTDIIGKMSPEARNALIDALLKTLIDKPKMSAVKSGNKPSQHPFDAALQPPLRVNQKADGPLVQPFSLTVDREKLRDLYKHLNTEKVRSGLKKTNVMINLDELLQETIKKECNTTNKPQCCHRYKTTKSVEAEARTAECTNGQMPEEEENSEELCNCDRCSDAGPSSIDFPGEDRVVKLTQIFNVHPKLLIVNGGHLVPSDIARLLNETAKTDTAKNAPTPTVKAPAPNGSPNPPTRSSHRKCTRRQLCRHGYGYRDDRRGHSPIQDLTYTYYVDTDDLPMTND